MVRVNMISSLILGATLTTFTVAAPVTKRIAQTISESTAEWEKACTAAGGAGQCNTISQKAFTSLLAAGGACDQQDSGDAMIDLAKQLNNDAEMIRLAQLFVQQPRNAPDSLQVPYCQTEPKNQELSGLFHCQFEGSDFTKFSGDQSGNVPLGASEVNPPGSCPAKTDGPVPDGVQLNTIATDPGAGNASGSTNGTDTTGSGSTNGTDTTGAGGSSTEGSGSTDAGGSTGKDTTGTGNGTSTDSGSTGTNSTGSDTSSSSSGSTGSSSTSAPSASSTGNSGSSSTSTGSASTPSASAGGDFLKANGEQAIQENQEFEGLSADDSCNDGETACVEGGFAQCVGGAWSITDCSSGTQCFSLPLVNKAGTSITCSTQEDADARIAATGAQ
ncbi:hypothetical protein CYLTODRAFT_364087 [Cylindrobasidium torrendii FP15055 ss-10]|uniref:Carbohydrate-binding module family 19 domain-containing protein n=1 Tax=Cylindrobasidium torrendii FP15055 ss-10 TaxID=1314674 RepID=A0A0D7BW08_9AGAR|nr:hypothetical protein CYLTODRAFT_364087 [Cylindrobasidium torrendii FP15055 ss-10]